MSGSLNFTDIKYLLKKCVIVLVSSKVIILRVTDIIYKMMHRDAMQASINMYSIVIGQSKKLLVSVTLA